MARAATGSRGTAGSAPQSKNGWQEPQEVWIPIGLAIFRFGIADNDVPTNEAPPARADLFSIEAFKQSRDSGEVSKIRYEPEPPTVEKLTELLREYADATKAEIDREEGRFRFYCGASCYGGTPWALLREPDESLKLKLAPRLASLLSDACEGSESPRGFAKVGDDEAAESARIFEDARFATGIVWWQYMRPAFDRAVKSGRVTLFARWPSISDDFQRLPSDIWPLLEIVDWEHGVACDIQGTLYSFIHVADYVSRIAASPTPDKSGGQSFEAQDRVLVEEMRALITRGEAKNVSAAARAVLPKAQKIGTDESAEERLRRAYGREYPTRTKAKSSEET